MDTTAICLARKSGTSFSELARVSGKSETEVRRIIATNKKGNSKVKIETTTPKLTIVESDDIVAELGKIQHRIGQGMITILADAIEAGRLLAEQKEKLTHNGWVPWLDANKERLGFNKRWAQVYMACYRNRELAKTHSGAFLTIKDLAKGGKSKVAEPKLSKKAKSLTFTHAVENKTVVVKDPPRSWMAAHRGKNLGSPDIIVCRKCHEYTQGGLGMMGAITGLIVSCECGNSTRQAEEVEE